MNYKFFKRFFDIIFSVFFIIITSPLLIIIALAVKVTSKGPIIYKGKRVGRLRKFFNVYKFRTMVKNAENLGGPSTAINDSRLTIIGRFLRKNKLDELPQFFNVLKGDMSFVGPRPQVKLYTDLYNNKLIKILNIRPGITDIASLEFLDMDEVLGEKDVDKYYKENIEPNKNKLRLYYVENYSFLYDLKILIKTFLSLIKVLIKT